MKIYVMDAFAAKLFGGNQAGVALPEGDGFYDGIVPHPSRSIPLLFLQAVTDR